MSENGPEKTIIDCGGSADAEHGGFTFDQVGHKGSVIEGFTIKNAFRNEGAAILCSGSSPRIANCLLVDNHSTDGSVEMIQHPPSSTALSPTTAAIPVRPFSVWPARNQSLRIVLSHIMIPAKSWSPTNRLQTSIWSAVMFLATATAIMSGISLPWPRRVTISPTIPCSVKMVLITRSNPAHPAPRLKARAAN